MGKGFRWVVMNVVVLWELGDLGAWRLGGLVREGLGGCYFKKTRLWFVVWRNSRDDIDGIW